MKQSPVENFRLKKMWEESLTSTVLGVDDAALGGYHPIGAEVADGGGGADGAVARDGGVPRATAKGGPRRLDSGPEGTQRRERSVLVHSRFQLALVDVDGQVSSLLPAGIDGLVRESRVGGQVSSMEVTYTRGNVGLYRMPAWYVQRGGGLVVRISRADGRIGGSGDGWRDVLVAIGRMLGSSTASILDAKSFVIREGGLEGWLTQDFPCVESIHRWMRLLPCAGQAGLSEVMGGLGLLELPYHSIRVVVDGEGEDRTLTVEVSGIVVEEGAGDVVQMIEAHARRWHS